MEVARKEREEAEAAKLKAQKERAEADEARRVYEASIQRAKGVAAAEAILLGKVEKVRVSARRGRPKRHKVIAPSVAPDSYRQKRQDAIVRANQLREQRELDGGPASNIPKLPNIRGRHPFAPQPPAKRTPRSGRRHRPEVFKTEYFAYPVN